MMQSFIEKAKITRRKIVLPEAFDERILQATRDIVSQGIAEVVLVGSESQIREALQDKAIIGRVAIYDPSIDNSLLHDLAQIYYDRQKKKGITPEQALDTVRSKPYYYGALLVNAGLADGMVCGADCTTAETLRAIIHCVGMREDSVLLSSFFMMVTQNKNLGKEGVLFFADCAVNPKPDASQLACIAIDTSRSFRTLMQDEPKVGLLSFSTRGSAKHPSLEKITDALKIARIKQPELLIDGEFQFDAAVVPAVGRKKAPDSVIAGQVNCLIFPDLAAGNIGYKIAERIGGALAIGPIIQGARKPVNDLSRGCSVLDIVNVVAITSLQVQP